MRGVVDDTQRRAPEVWLRHLSYVPAGFRPAGQPPAYRPDDDFLVYGEVHAPQARP